MSKKEAQRVFRKLFEECQKKDTYSVIETAEKMGVSYAQVKKWAMESKEAAEVLEFCRECCGSNAEVAGLKWKLPSEEAFKYMRENDDQMQKEYEKEQWEKEREMLEKNNLEIPESRITNVKLKAIQDGNIITLSKEFEDKDLTNKQKVELDTKDMLKTTGTANEEFSRLLLAQTVGGSINGQDHTFMFNAAKGALMDLKPRDATEGMLCSHLVTLHNQAMNFIARTTHPEQTQAGIDLNINRATKLMRLFNETLEALNRYRRNGQQKITVQHVNVADGGQAIIGNLKTGGGVGDEEKK